MFAAAALLIAASSCSEKTSISGVLTDAPEAEIVVKRLSGSTMETLDTLKTNPAGAYSYKMDIKEGQPEFVYLFSGDDRIASLLLQKGDKVKVTSGQDGKCQVEGSEESVKLNLVEDEFATFMNSFADAVQSGENQAASKLYVDYYRSRLKYIMENVKSLTTIPVLYQKINDNFPVFSQSTDAVVFQTVHDSLVTVYPDSKYVAALAREAKNRSNILSVEQKLLYAKEAGFPDVELPTIDGTKVRLSEVEAKVIMVIFWQASDAIQKLFNQDVLLPIYNTYKPKGLEIFSISLDTDKGEWASVVKSQELPWINVCDGHGAATPAFSLFNVNKGFPVAYFIVDGKMIPDVVTSEKDIRRILSANLK